MLCALIYSILGTSGLDVQVLAMAREHCETLEMTLFSDCVGGSKAVVLTWPVTQLLYTQCVIRIQVKTTAVFVSSTPCAIL